MIRGGLVSRRSVLVVAGATTVTALGAVPALAVTKSEAERLVGRLVDDINAVIDSGKSEAGMIRDFEAIFRRYGDLPLIAASAFGPDARRASNAQKKAFTDAFTGYIARKYGKRFREFIGARLEVQDTRSGRNRFEVKTTAFLRGQSPFEIAFFVSAESGLFFNMFIEGVNLLLSERTEIGAMLDQRGGSISRLARDLRNT